MLLKHLAAKLKDAIFISVDTLDQEHDLFATVKLLKENFHYQHYSLDEVHSQKTPDYLLDDRRFRKTVNKIGSNSKGRDQFKSVENEEKFIFTHSDKTEDIKRPLFLLGFIA